MNSISAKKIKPAEIRNKESKQAKFIFSSTILKLRNQKLEAVQV